MRRCLFGVVIILSVTLTYHKPDPLVTPLESPVSEEVIPPCVGIFIDAQPPERAVQ